MLLRRPWLPFPLILCAAAVALTACWSGDSQPERGRAATPKRPPVVMLVFDEFSTTSLLDEHGRIDSALYPSFAALAREATWFPYATASLDETGRALRSLMTGRTAWRFAKPTYANEPHNLFTLLASHYRIEASEEVSSLCPRRLCRHVRSQTRRSILHSLASGRPERFARWLRSVRPPRRPTLYFKHILFPHGPWRYLPSGHRYGDGPIRRRFSWNLQHFNRWLVNQTYQRHLLQVGFTDRLLGRALDRLRATGLYDRALVVVTADNGESFGRLGNGHEISAKNAGDIALTPLLIKLPYQRWGRIVRRHVRTIDVVPTIARVARLRPRWRTEGRPVFGPAARRIPASTLLVQRSGHRIRLSASALRRRAAEALRLKLRLFGSGGASPGLYGIGPYRFMHGTPLTRWRVLAHSGTRAVLDEPGRYRRNRRPSGLLPVTVMGHLAGTGSRRPVAIAVAANGTIAATAPTIAARRYGTQLFSVLVPEAALREGANSIVLFAIVGSGRQPQLRPLTR